MTTELQIVNEQPKTPAVVSSVDPFEAFADAVSPKFIRGTLLRFAKGDYVYGEKSDIMPLGTKMIASVDELLTGWVRWEAGKPAEHAMVRVIDGESPKSRSQLGFHDEALWELDASGNPRDCWQFTQYLPMVTENGEVYTFSTGSRGGLGAIADLARTYARGRKTHSDDFPVIVLHADSYVHKNAQFGRIKFPQLRHIGWTAKSTYWSAVGIEDANESAEETKGFGQPTDNDVMPF